MDIIEATRNESNFVRGVSTRGAQALIQAAQATAAFCRKGLCDSGRCKVHGTLCIKAPYFQGQPKCRIDCQIPAPHIGASAGTAGKPMSFVFVIFLVLAGLALQKWMLPMVRRDVQSTYRPDENIVDTGDMFFIHIQIENHSKWPIPYVKVKMYFRQRHSGYRKHYAV